MVGLNKKEVIRRIKKENRNLKKFGVKKIGLFGSMANGKQNKKSDVDILVSFNSVNFDSYMGLYYFLKRIMKRRVDLVIESDLKPELEYVKKEAIYVKL